MTMFQILPLLAILLAYAFLALRMSDTVTVPWHVPALASVAFGVFTVWVILQEGLFGFWPNHSQDGWGNQVWIDLLSAVVISMVFLVPKARAVGMRVLPWVLFVATTASIGLFAMLARVMYLEHAQARSQVADTVQKQEKMA